MASHSETAAVLALLRDPGRSWAALSAAISETGSAVELLATQGGLLAPQHAEAEMTAIEKWRADGIRIVTMLDPDYPDNLHGVHDRPPLIFVRGTLRGSDGRSVAIVGSRNATRAGLARTRQLAHHLLDGGYAILSGLARGIDTAAHAAALQHDGRTIAVLGTGLNHVHPPENRELQRRIGTTHALISPFRPDTPPSRATFPIRNAVMSGLSLGTVIVEANHTSGTRIQARHALGHGRPVFLRRELLAQPWAQTLAQRPGVHVFEHPEEVSATIERLGAVETLTE